MKYMLLIYGDESLNPNPTPEEIQAEMGAYMAFQASLDSKGVEYSGEALFPTAAATTVRVRDNQSLTTDGPFAETKEQLGGFYMVDADNLDDAIAIAAGIPGAATGCVEVRPIMDFSQM